MKKFEHKEKIEDSIRVSFTWECNLCGCELSSDEEDMSKSDFAEDLYRSGIRYKKMKGVEGLFCKECIDNPDQSLL
jgi:hypothetical protein